MPLAFPSHQGLVLPLWRRFPTQLDGVSLSVGAAMPDVVDALAWPLRGELGQLAGHSLVGVALFCTPLGIAASVLARRVRWLARLDAHPFRFPRAAWSVAIGALSHVAFDLVTHANFVLLWPFVRDAKPFPAWWTHAWAHVALPIYREPYPIAPHTIAWALASVLGAWLFVRCLSDGSDRSRTRARG